MFSRPDDFEPERFAAPREEDKAAPFSFIGFGGGRHGCMGSNFAILQVCRHALAFFTLPCGKTSCLVLLSSQCMREEDAPFPSGSGTGMRSAWCGWERCDIICI